MHKEVLRDIKQLQDGLDITSGTDVVSLIQNDRNFQETAKNRDKDETNKQ